MSDRDSEVARLYALPLGEFTPARNALAKARKDPSIKALEKPNLSAWAVNQIYWHAREQYRALVQAAERVHGEHRKLLGGKPADIRGAEQAHREQVRAAIERIKRLLDEGGQAVTPATLAAAQETLEALPGGETPGQLTRPLKPRGFEALAGVTVKPALQIVKPSAAAGAAGAGAGPRRETPLQREREQKRREAEERARKAERQEAARALAAAEKAMLAAEEAVKKAERSLAELRTRRDAAVSDYQRARLRAHE